MITPAQLKNMVEHWLDTPPNGYFAQGYGADVKSLLLQNLSAENADKLLTKLKTDIPLLAQIDSEGMGGGLSIETEAVGFDTLNVYLFVADIPIKLGNTRIDNSNQDYYDPRAS